VRKTLQKKKKIHGSLRVQGTTNPKPPTNIERREGKKRKNFPVDCNITYDAGGEHRACHCGKEWTSNEGKRPYKNPFNRQNLTEKQKKAGR